MNSFCNVYGNIIGHDCAVVKTKAKKTKRVDLGERLRNKESEVSYCSLHIGGSEDESTALV
jgi:hypothetical protein